METAEEIRSEWVHDYLEEIPSWLIRWGTLLFALIVLSLFLVAWFIQYPTIVECEFRLTSSDAPKAIISKIDGRIEKLFVKDKQNVTKGFVLGYIESTANHEEVLTLEKELANIQSIVSVSHWQRLENIRVSNFKHLGDVQSSYQSFQNSYIQVISLLSGNFYTQKRNFLMKEIEELSLIQTHQIAQRQIYQRDATLAENAYQVSQKLYNEKVITPLEINQEESKLLAKKLPIQNIETTILNNNALKNAKYKEILDLDKVFKEQTEALRQALNVLQSNITTWKNRYVLIAPTNGTIQFATLLQEKQQVKTGTDLMFLSNSNVNSIGELRIPQTNFGKIKEQQRVIIKFNGYPYQEYGAVEGMIANVSNIPTPDNQFFIATVILPNGLHTTYKKTLHYRYNMTANAGVITEDLRLLERLFYQFRGLWQY
jgi:multidrug resistance efflux pump